MSVSLTGSGVSALSIRMKADQDLHRLAFRTSDWNRIERASLFALGEWFIGERLPWRFNEWAIPNLGYPPKKQTTKNTLAQAMASGLVDRICAQRFHGWNPWRSGSNSVPGPLWQQWLERGKRLGRYQFSASGVFGRAKRDLRKYVKEAVRGEINARYDDHPDDVFTPLVFTGELRRTVLADSRPIATATSTRSDLRIVMPQPHPTHPVVSAVLHRVTTQELEDGAKVYGEALESLVMGSQLRVIRRGANAGQVRRSLSAEQRAAIAHTTQRRTPLDQRRSAP